MLIQLAEQEREPGERLQAVLEAYALIQHQHPSNHLAAVLHSGDHAVRAEAHLRTLVRDLIAAGAEAAAVRRDVSPDALASYCLHALRAAGEAPDEAAVRRLVELTIAGMRVP
jgi:hypothetical protein